jgi:putative transposase
MSPVEVKAMHGQGLSYRRLSETLAIPRSTLAGQGADAKPRLEVAGRDGRPEGPLKLWIAELKKLKPTWGIRRVMAWIRKALEISIGRKRTARLLRELNLLCPRIRRRVHRLKKPPVKATCPNQLWSMDMTSFLLTSGQKLFLEVVMDVFDRRLVGWHLSFRCRAREWLEALEMGLLSEFPEGVRGRGLTLRMDNGCQPTSGAFQSALRELAITPEWTGYNCPEQNGHVERLIGTLKADWLWLEECGTFDEAETLVRRAVTEYNQEHPHSSLGYLSPDCSAPGSLDQEESYAARLKKLSLASTGVV